MLRLETERLLFRDHELGDLDAYCELESDPIYRAPQRVQPRAELERGFSNGLLRPKDLGLFATVFKEDGRYIGRCGLYHFRNPQGETRTDEALIGFYIGRPYWGRGLATEAGRAWIRYAFEVLGLRRIEAGIAADNVASLRVVEKLGFRWLRSGGAGTRWHDLELWNPGVGPQPNEEL